MLWERCLPGRGDNVGFGSSHLQSWLSYAHSPRSCSLPIPAACLQACKHTSVPLFSNPGCLGLTWCPWCCQEASALEEEDGLGVMTLCPTCFWWAGLLLSQQSQAEEDPVSDGSIIKRETYSHFRMLGSCLPLWHPPGQTVLKPSTWRT